jgi:hypothetical protein
LATILGAPGQAGQLRHPCATIAPPWRQSERWRIAGYGNTDTDTGMGQVRMGKLQRLVYSSDGFPLSENGDFDGKH